ncbi:hypothetical protein LTS18_009398, partial [Coniosporium uncinatum]
MASDKKLTQQDAERQDAEDPLRHLRDEFRIPTRADLKKKRIRGSDSSEQTGEPAEPCTYLCGNSLGLQPKRTLQYVSRYLETWATQGVFGHFKRMEDALTPPWLDLVNDEATKKQMGDIVGALPEEVAIMQTLTANIHLLMASFYRPTKDKYKILIEGKAFPSDHYAILSQLAHHNIDPENMITITPPSGAHTLFTSHILSTIDEHASSTALILLPGIQFYTGQFFDIQRITAHAHSHGITCGWDLAHAAGNVPLQLHAWDVDFAAWCSYKYLNSGPGAIAGLFVHEKHGKVTSADAGGYLPRLSGWWGSDVGSRFKMENQFVPIPGAAGWQLSNPSAIDATAVLASLSVFGTTSMEELRRKSLGLTGYLEGLLKQADGMGTLYDIITPGNPEER